MPKSLKIYVSDEKVISNVQITQCKSKLRKIQLKTAKVFNYMFYKKRHTWPKTIYKYIYYQSDKSGKNACLLYVYLKL